MRGLLHTLALAAALPLLGGCLEFEKQTLLLKLDPKADVLHVRLLYDGIYAGEGDIEKALGQLHEVVHGKGRFFLLDNWPLAFDLGDGGQNVHKVSTEYASFLKLQNGRFFLDNQGRLCGWQDLRIAPFSKFLAKVNKDIHRSILEDLENEGDLIGAKSVPLLKEAAKKGRVRFVLDQRGLRFTAFLSAEDTTRLKVRLFGRNKDTDPEVREYALSRNRWSWNHEGNEVSVGLGADGDGVIRLHWWNPENRYLPNLVTAPEGKQPPKLPGGIDKTVRRDKLESDFPRAAEAR